MTLTQSIAVKTQFTSYQGTGINAGVRQRFVRLAGCSVPCPLRANCDQPEALNHNDKTDTDVDSIIDDAISVGWLHITGGEPAEHEHFTTLCEAAVDAGLKVQVQTSGTIPFAVPWSVFVSVSPKQRAVNVHASELVLIATKWMTPEFALEVTDGTQCPVFVVPESTDGDFQTQSMINLLELLANAGRDARAGLQSHLIWGVN